MLNMEVVLAENNQGVSFGTSRALVYLILGQPILKFIFKQY